MTSVPADRQPVGYVVLRQTGTSAPELYWLAMYTDHEEAQQRAIQATQQGRTGSFFVGAVIGDDSDV